MPVVVIGANGQLAHDLIPALAGAGYEVTGFLHSQIEITNINSVREILGKIPHDTVINTAAYHKVDELEENPSRAFSVNSIGPYNLASVCRETGATLIHLSTDYVFSGQKGRPYLESDAPSPVNIYGISKAAGEMAIRYVCPHHYIIRTSGLYGAAGPSGKGSNFVDLMIKLAGEGKPIRVVNDQTLTPTTTKALSAQIVKLLPIEEYGTFHATCQGECTWFDFAAGIFKHCGLRPSLSPQTTAQSGAKAVRPAYSVLENAHLKRLGQDIMPSWQQALGEYLKEKGYSQ
jgi:dTDP-4-dehydrorhamnose reductase